jgi:hypothetical protein
VAAQPVANRVRRDVESVRHLANPEPVLQQLLEDDLGDPTFRGVLPSIGIRHLQAFSRLHRIDLGRTWGERRSVHRVIRGGS